MIINPMMPVAILIVMGVAGAAGSWLIKNWGMRILNVIMVILLVIMGLRPMVPNGEAITYKNNLEVILVMDNTLSMLAEDHDGNGRRIDAVVDDILYIINKLPGAYYSLISFGNNSTVNLRSTIDANAAVVAAKTTHQTDAMYARGSDVTVFKEDLKKILQASTKKEGRRRVVFVLTDGENTAGDELASLADLKQYVDDGAVLGYGTTQGGKMKVDEYGTGNYAYLEYYDDDFSKKAAVSKIDENNLRSMAADLGVEYIHMQKQSDLDQKINSIQSGQELSEGETEYAYDDIYYYFGWGLIAVLLIEIYVGKREYWQ